MKSITASVVRLRTLKPSSTAYTSVRYGGRCGTGHSSTTNSVARGWLTRPVTLVHPGVRTLTSWVIRLDARR